MQKPRGLGKWLDKQKQGVSEMKQYKIKVEESHIIEKVYFIDADNMKEAKARAKNNDWDDATQDENTGIIAKIKIVSATRR